MKLLIILSLAIAATAEPVKFRQPFARQVAQQNGWGRPAAQKDPKPVYGPPSTTEAPKPSYGPPPSEAPTFTYGPPVEVDPTTTEALSESVTTLTPPTENPGNIQSIAKNKTGKLTNNQRPLFLVGPQRERLVYVVNSPIIAVPEKDFLRSGKLQAFGDVNGDFLSSRFVQVYQP